MMNDELERIWKEVVIARSKYYPDIFLKGSRKTMKNFCLDSKYPVEIRSGHLVNTSEQH
jgi:hypothetical protein